MFYIGTAHDTYFQEFKILGNGMISYTVLGETIQLFEMGTAHCIKLVLEAIDKGNADRIKDDKSLASVPHSWYLGSTSENE